MIQRIFRYSLVGIANTIICIAVMYIFAMMHFHYVIYTAAGYLVSILSSFFLNMIYTFRVQGDIAKRLTIFVIINLFNLLITELIQIYLIEVVHIEHIIAIALAMSWYIVFGFFMNQKFVYQSQI